MTVENLHRVKVTAPLHTEAASLATVAEALSLPSEDDRQPDLQYLTAIFVSSGMNKNGAVFLGSELIKARGTISDKAVDIEHDERSIIGQITGNAFLKRDRSLIDAETASSTMSVEEMDELEMDIGITAIIHKARFPEIAQEIEEGQWMVSMEAYYRDYDIKVGDKIIPKEEAEKMGFDKLVGSVVHLKDGDKELGFHLVGRVLRDILFAGVGIVKNPANPRSIIMEAAAINEYANEEGNKHSDDMVTVDLSTMTVLSEVSSEVPKVDAVENYKKFIKETVQEAVEAALDTREQRKQEQAQDIQHKTPGTCVSYARYIHEYPDPSIEEPATDLTQIPLLNPPGPGGAEYPGARVVAEHWCKLFDMECSARPGDATMPTCWRNVFARTVKEELDSHEEVLRQRRIQEGLVSLQALLDDARKFRQ